MDLINLAKWQSGEQIRLMEVFSLALSLSELKFDSYVMKSGPSFIVITIFSNTEEDSLEIQKFVSGYLDPAWIHRHSFDIESSEPFWCDSYRYCFMEEEG